jgi:hypothetical protein
MAYSVRTAHHHDDVIDGIGRAVPMQFGATRCAHDDPISVEINLRPRGSMLAR